MRKLLFSILILITASRLFAQFKEIDEKNEFLGTAFLSAPDYSKLEYFKPAPNNFNLYTFKSQQTFKTIQYSLSNIYIGVKKGRILDFLCEISSDQDYEAIREDLSNSFSLQFTQEKGKTYHGRNIIFSLSKDNGSKGWLFMATNEPDTISNVKDNTGIIALLGKKYSDTEVKQFLSTLPKSEKKIYDKEQVMEIAGPGFTIVFNGADDNAVLKSLNFDLNKDGYYVTKSTFKSPIPLPYGITSSTTVNQLRDMFGDDDGSNYKVVKEIKYRKYNVIATFNQPIKAKKDEEVLVTLKIE